MEQLNAISEEIASIGRKLEDLYKLPSIAESVESSAVVKELLEHVDALGMSVDRVCRDSMVMAKTLKALTNKDAWLKRFSHQRGCYEHVFIGTKDVAPAILGNGATMMEQIGNGIMQAEISKDADAGLG